MVTWFKKIFDMCTSRYDDLNENPDPNTWCRDQEWHFSGEFSFAVVQANQNLEDFSHVVTGSRAIFLGVYDGHGGVEASRFVRNNLFDHVIRNIEEKRTMSLEVLRAAVAATEQGFMDVTRMGYSLKPDIVEMGSCCLVGVIWKGTLYIANLGDSRAVLGSLNHFNKITAKQLTKDHNVNNEEIRQELWQSHPDDPGIVLPDDGTYRVKGLIQVSRSIGDAYLKLPPFSSEPGFPRNTHVPPPFNRGVLSAEPALYTKVLKRKDRFIIFASDGLWEFLTNQEAVETVHKHPRIGIARRLIKAAQKVAASGRNTDYRTLTRITAGRDRRRTYHDDITVIVVFLEHQLLMSRANMPVLSIKGFDNSADSSSFNRVEEFM